MPICRLPLGALTGSPLTVRERAKEIRLGVRLRCRAIQSVHERFGKEKWLAVMPSSAISAIMCHWACRSL